MEEKIKEQVLPLTVDRFGLANILHRSPITIYKHIYYKPHLLPPAVQGIQPRIWIVSEVMDWLKNKQGQAPAPAPTPVKRGRGRPRKNADLVVGRAQ